jgi:hypothetical protein
MSSHNNVDARCDQEHDAIPLATARRALLWLEDDPEDLVARLVARLGVLLRRNFGVSYLQCDLLLCDLRRDLVSEVAKFAHERRRCAELALEQLLEEDADT